MLAAATSARRLRIEHNGRRCCIDESLRLTVAVSHWCGSGGVWVYVRRFDLERRERATAGPSHRNA
jgi:hypothetical protein